MILRIGLAGSALAIVSASAAAQFSSDFPGVPRGAISIRGGTQARTEWTLSGNKLPSATSSGDTIGVGLRLGIGRSYRVGDQFEVGFDYTLMDLTAQMPPSAAAGAPSAKNYLRGMIAYAFRVGAKMRPYSSIDQDGNGIEASFGIGYQPALKTLFGVEHIGDSSRTGGQFSGKDATGGTSTVFTGNPFASVQSSVTIGAMGSYRSKRLNADVALINESVQNPSAGSDPSPVKGYDGFSLRLGGAYRVTRRIALGASYWGSGAPPWRDEILIAVPSESKASDFALLFQFGSAPEGGTDLMLSSPTGNFAESIRVFVRTRRTR